MGDHRYDRQAEVPGRRGRFEVTVHQPAGGRGRECVGQDYGRRAHLAKALNFHLSA